MDVLVEETNEKKIEEKFGSKCIQELRFGELNSKISVTLNNDGQRKYKRKLSEPVN